MRSQSLPPFRMPDDFNLFLYGDTQWGNVGTHERGLDKMFEAIHSEYRGCRANYAVHMGDHIEGIVVGDKRFAFDQLKPKKYFLRAQIDHAINRERELRGKQLLLLNGNHEHIWSNTYGDICAEIADGVGCAYGMRAAVMRLERKKNGRPIGRVFVHHGAGRLTSNAKDSVQRMANMMAQLKLRLQGMFDGAALMVMGHTHQLLVVPPDNAVKMIAYRDGELRQAYPLQDDAIIIDQTASYIPPEFRWYVNTGSFLRGYSEDGVSYAEAAMLRPVEIGYCVAAYRGAKLVKVYREVV